MQTQKPLPLLISLVFLTIVVIGTSIADVPVAASAKVVLSVLHLITTNYHVYCYHYPDYTESG